MKTKKHSENKIQTNKTLTDNPWFATHKLCGKRPFLIYKWGIRTPACESPSNSSTLFVYNITMKTTQTLGNKFGSDYGFL